MWPLPLVALACGSPFALLKPFGRDREQLSRLFQVLWRGPSVQLDSELNHGEHKTLYYLNIEDKIS
jgi:hypothetical protein